MATFIIVTFFVVMFVIFWVWLSVVIWSLKNGISPMPTSEKVKRKILSSIPPQIHGTIVDLGSGWGTMAMQLAKKFPHCQVIGYETSPIPYYFSCLWQYFDKTPNLYYKKKNFFKEPLNQVSLLYMYLYPDAMKKLQSKLEKELQPGTIVISNTFAIPNWKPLRIVEVADLYHSKVYMYVNSSRVDDQMQVHLEKKMENKSEILI